MKTNIFTFTLAAIVAVGISTSARAASPNATSAANAPAVTVLFHHTAANPYDVLLLSWCGGYIDRVEVVPQTTKTFVVAYNTGSLHGAKITGADSTTVGFRVCKNGKKTVLFDLLCPEQRKMPVPALVTRLSSIPEWQTALYLQAHGQLNVATFAHPAVVKDQRDQYAYSAEPMHPAL